MSDIDTMIAVMQAYADGAKIEQRELGDPTLTWEGTAIPLWNWARFRFRIAVTKPSVDWSCVSDEFKFLATDASGRTFLYSKEPAADEVTKVWYSPGSSICTADILASFRKGNCPWQDSVVKRT